MICALEDEGRGVSSTCVEGASPLMIIFVSTSIVFSCSITEFSLVLFLLTSLNLVSEVVSVE